jgi:hypothetical protein
MAGIHQLKLYEKCTGVSIPNNFFTELQCYGGNINNTKGIHYFAMAPCYLDDWHFVNLSRSKGYYDVSLS